MDAADLRDLWSRNKDRPAWVREHRDALAEYVDTDEPIPDDQLWRVREWLNRYKSTVTKQLNAAVDGEGS